MLSKLYRQAAGTSLVLAALSWRGHGWRRAVVI
jgi:hypothetical protein